MNKKLLSYLVDKSVEWFDEEQQKSYDWILARIAVNEYNSNNSDYPPLKIIRYKVLCYVINNICKSYIHATKIDTIKSVLNFFSDNIDNNNQCKDILLFLVSWNIHRFISLRGSNRLDLSKWICALHDILQTNNSNELCNLSSEDAFRRVLGIYHDKLKLNEYDKVITAKTLLLLCPDKFIAWDNQIADLFDLREKDAKDYSRFNNAISRFIEDHQFKLNIYLKEQTIHFYQYTERKVLDMILYMRANNKINNPTFVKYSNILVSKIKSYINN